MFLDAAIRADFDGSILARLAFLTVVAILAPLDLLAFISACCWCPVSGSQIVIEDPIGQGHQPVFVPSNSIERASRRFGHLVPHDQGLKLAIVAGQRDVVPPAVVSVIEFDCVPIPVFAFQFVRSLRLSGADRRHPKDFRHIRFRVIEPNGGPLPVVTMTDTVPDRVFREVPREDDTKLLVAPLATRIDLTTHIRLPALATRASSSLEATVSSSLCIHRGVWVTPVRTVKRWFVSCGSLLGHCRFLTLSIRLYLVVRSPILYTLVRLYYG